MSAVIPAAVLIAISKSPKARCGRRGAALFIRTPFYQPGFRSFGTVSQQEISRANFSCLQTLIFDLILNHQHHVN